MTNGRGLSEESDSACRCGATKTLWSAGYPIWFLAVIKAHAHLRQTRISGTKLYGVLVGSDGKDHRAASQVHESPHHLANAVYTLNNHSRAQLGPAAERRRPRTFDRVGFHGSEPQEEALRSVWNNMTA